MAEVLDYLHRKAAARKIPLSGTFELSPVCNFSCRMCYLRKTPEQIAAEGKKLRTWQEWLELGKRCKNAGMLHLLLTGGEPFLYPGFRELYEQLHRMGILLSINSNGTLIDRETVAWLKENAPARVNITLYGTSPETYGRMCGNSSGYEKAIAAIRMLKDAGIPVVINASMIPENADDLEGIIATGRELDINTRVSTYMFPPVRREREASDSRFTPEEAAGIYMRKMKCTLSDAQYADFLMKKAAAFKEDDPDDWGVTEEYMRCRAGRSGFWVAWDGKMTACGLTNFPTTVYPFEEDFLQCWMKLTDKVRTTPVLKGCAGCGKREYCGVCVAMAHIETGDVNRKAPYLCRMAEKVDELIQAEVENHVE